MKLVPDWKQCWRWNSMHAMGFAGVVITVWNLLPEDFQNAFPHHVVLGLASGTLVLGIIGRLRDQGTPPPKPPVPRSNDFHQGSD